VYTSAAKVFGSRISVRGELVEEAKRRGADSEAASAISVRGELVCGRCPSGKALSWRREVITGDRHRVYVIR
jgi:hypothetical protein